MNSSLFPQGLSHWINKIHESMLRVNTIKLNPQSVEQADSHFWAEARPSNIPGSKHRIIRREGAQRSLGFPMAP